jgi:hypothetical protein
VKHPSYLDFGLANNTRIILSTSVTLESPLLGRLSKTPMPDKLTRHFVKPEEEEDQTHEVMCSLLQDKWVKKRNFVFVQGLWSRFVFSNASNSTAPKPLSSSK